MVSSQSNVAEGDAPAAEHGPHDAPAQARCLDCGASLHGPFCSSCGQRDYDHRKRLKHLVGHFIAETFDLDSRLARTLERFLLRPGELTVAYNEGQRTRFTSPLRLLLLALVLDLLSSALWWDMRGEESADGLQVSFTSGVSAGVSVSDGVSSSNDAVTLDMGDLLSEDESPGGDQLLEIVSALRKAASKEEAFYASRLEAGAEKLERFARGTLEQRVALFRLHGQKVTEYATRGLAALIPLFACVLHGLYFRRRMYYVEHVVFFVHAMAFFLLASAIGTWLGAWAPLLGWLAPFAYFWLAMRRVYGESPLRTTLKWLAVCVVYGFGFFVAISLASILVLFSA